MRQSETQEGGEFLLQVLTKTDWNRLDALFQRVFEHALDATLADYKYAHGRGESIALAHQSGRLVAHCGMIFRELLEAGKPINGVQFGDLMVDPDVRGILSRQGQPFYRVFTGALQRLATPVKPLVFGFPSERATRLGERLGLVTEMDQMLELVWPISDKKLKAIGQPTFGQKLGKNVDKLWLKMAKDLSDAVVGVRDSGYFERRYFQHPTYQYKVFLLRSRWLKRPLGVFVLRDHGTMIELVDWVGPLDNGLAIVEQARRAAAGLGAACLMSWSPKAYASRFALGATSCKPTKVCVAVGGEIPSTWVEQFKGRIWGTAGDTDYR